MAVTNNFSSSELDLNDVILLSQPTALVWGPDGRLYVTEVNGSVKVLTVAFGDPDPTDEDPVPKFYVTEAFELTTITGFNYDDDGTYNPTLEADGRERQVTGIDVVQQYDSNGDAVFIGDKPAVDIYVTSSDPRHGAGNNGGDTNLDTNSGVVHRLRETDDVANVASANEAFTTVDLVRGFARSEENHSINGLEIIQEVDETGALISERAIVAVGGNANTGAPSNNFAGQQEYALSAGVFELDISLLDTFGVQTDATSGRSYVYDLPTLDDPSQTGTSDQNDPFGGNDGFNQTILLDQNDPNNPVKLYSPGYRNAYDVEVTDDGRVWTYDNGANNSWGGRPIGEAGDNGGTIDFTQDPNYIATNLNNGDGNANDEISLEDWDPSNLDNFHEITRSDDLETGETISIGGNGPVATYTDPTTGLTLVYGGHPNPTRAEGSKAGLLFTPNGNDDDAVLLVSATNAEGDDLLPSDYDDVIAWYTQVEADYGLPANELTKRVIEATPGDLYDIYEGPNNTSIAVVSGESAPTGDVTFIGTAGLPSNIHDVVARANPIEGNYLEAGNTDGALDSAFGSVNGLAEYTSTVLDNPITGTTMSGAILASTFNGGGLIVMGRNPDGTMSSVSGTNGAIAADRTVILDSGQTLGLATIGDDIEELGLSAAFQGSIWAAVYKIGSSFSVDIEIFQPVGVGIPLADQIIVDENDQDSDGIDVINDPFEFSDTNGYDLTVGQTLNLDFEANTNAFAGSFAGTGLLGAALDGTTSNRDARTEAEEFPIDLQRDGLFDDGGNIIPGGNAPVFQIKDVVEGTVVGGANSVRDAMHTGVNLDDEVKMLVATLNMKNWLPSQVGGAVEGQLTGLMFSDGTQSNFLRVVFGGVAGNNPGLEVGWEIGDVGYTTLAQIALPELNLAINSEIDLRLSVRGIGTTFDVAVEYKLESESDFTEVQLNGGAGFQLPTGVLQDILTGAHTITDDDGPVASSGAAIGLLAETPPGTELLAIDFNNLAIEARGNEISVTTGADVGTAGTTGIDTIIYDGTDTDLAPLAADVENFDGTGSLADYAVTGNDLENIIAVGEGANTITTGDGDDNIVGTLAQLSGDTITDMAIGDTVIITDLTLADAANVTYGGTGSAELTINGATITFTGPDFADFDTAEGDAIFQFEEGAEGLEITAIPPSLLETVVYRVNFGAEGSVAAIDGGPDWADDDAAINGFSTTIPNVSATSNNLFNVDYDNVDADVVPDAVFQTEASDNKSDDAPSTINFDVEIGETYRIEYFYTENWKNIFGGGPRIFDVEIEGAIPEGFDDINPLAEAEAFVVANGGQTITDAGITNSSSNAEKNPYLNVARKAEYIYTATDDTLNLALLHQAQNPKINAIQVSIFGVPSTDALVSIGNTPVQIENGDTGVTLVELPLAVGDPGFTGQLTLDYDITVNGVTQAFLGQVVNFVDTGAFIEVAIPADIQNNGDDIISITLTAVAEEGYAIDGGAATGTSSVAEDDAPINPTFPFIEDTNNDLSDDRFNPTDMGQLAEGDNLITSTQQGDSEPGARDRDYFTFEVPDGQVLTQLILDNYIPGELTGIQGGFLALAAGATVELDPNTLGQGQSIPELLGGHIYDPTQIGQDLLPELADGEVFGVTTQGFTLPLTPGVYTIWLNQGGEASTPTINLKTVLSSSLPSVAIADAPTEVENGNVGVTTLTFPVTLSPAEATTLTLTFTVEGVETTADVIFDAAGNGVLSVDAANDDIFTGTDVIDVILTGATNGVVGDYIVIDSAANTASGSIIEDDDVLSTAPDGDFDNDTILNQDDTDIDGDANGAADNSTSVNGFLDISETFIFDATNSGTTLTAGQVVRQDFDIEGTPFMNGFTGALLSPNAQAIEIDLNSADVSGGTLNITANTGDHFASNNNQQNAFVAAYTAPEGLSVETRFEIPDFDPVTAGDQAPLNFQALGVVIGTDQDNMVKVVWGREAQSFQLLQDNANSAAEVNTGAGTTPANAAEIMLRLEVFLDDAGNTPSAKARAVATFFDDTGAAIAGFTDIAIGEINLQDNTNKGSALKSLVESGAALGAGVIQTSVGGASPDAYTASYQYLEVTALGTSTETAPVVALSNTVTALPEDADLSASIKVADITVTDDGVSAVTLGLTGADAALFEIVDNGGALELHVSAGAALDFETNPNLNVTVGATDNAGTGLAAFSAIVGDVNEAPTVTGTIGDASTSVGTPTTIDLSGLILADVDAGDSPVLKVLIDGTDIASVAGFTLNGTTLELDDTLAGSIYSVELFANDGALDSATSVQFSVTVSDSVVPALTVAVPTEIDGDITVTIDFGEPVFGFNPANITLTNGEGLSLTNGTATFQDGDQVSVVTFAAPIGGFAQDTDYGAGIGEGAVLDAEGNSNIATSAAPIPFAIDEGPVFVSGATAINLNEETGGVIETYAANDPDNDAVTYALDVAGQALGFTINQTTGALSAPAGGFDYETLVAGSGTTLTFDIIASSTGTDAVAKTATTTVTVDIVDQLENGTPTTTTFEVEDFEDVLPIAQSNAGEFFEENQSAASGGQVARLGAATTGTASLTLDANSGVTFGSNDIEITYFDESDGISTFTLNVNGTPVGTVTLNNDGGSNAAQSSNIRTKTFENVDLPEGAVITIDGAAQGGEFVRLDKITITTSGGNQGGDNQAPAAVGTIDLSGLTQGDTINVALGGNNPVFVDPDEDALSYTLSANAPDFLAIVDGVLVNTRVITNQDVIDSLTNGPVTVTVTASDTQATATASFDISVTNLNDAPVVLSENVSTLDLTTTDTAISPINAALYFDDPDFAISTSGEVLSYSATGLPSNLGIDPSTGQITGTLTAPGTFNVAITATDAGGLQATANFSINVTGQPLVGEAIRIQVEDFDNIADAGGFFTENQAAADQNQVARLGANGSGEATLALSGLAVFVPGLFDVTLGFFDENDGNSVVDVIVRTSTGDTIIDTIVFNADSGGNAAQASSFREVTLNDVTLPADATLVLAAQAGSYDAAEAAAAPGRTAGQEFARLDYVDLVPATGASDNFAPFPIPGFETSLEAVEGNAVFNVANAFGDPEEDILTYALVPAAGETDVPAFLSIDPATGVVSMTGASVNADTLFSFQVSATDANGSGQTALQTFTLNVTDSPLPTAQISVAATQTEGVQGQVTIDLIGGPVDFADPVTVRLALSAETTGDAATPGLDVAFDTLGATTVDIVVQPGSSGLQSLIFADDGPIEALESFRVEIVSANVGSVIDPNAAQISTGAASEVTISDADDAPVTVDEAQTVGAGDSVTFDPATSDTDADSSALAVTAIDTTATTGGTVVLNGDGTVTVTAETDTQATAISFGYTVEDEFGNTSAGVETVTINDETTSDPVVLRINGFGADVAPTDGGPVWLGDTAGGGAVQYLVAQDNRGDDDGYSGDQNAIPSSVPSSVLDTARSSNSAFSYSIPVTDIGGPGVYRVNLYVAELFGNAQSGGFRNFDAALENIVLPAFDNIDPGAVFGANVGVLSAEVDVLDGALDIGFLQDIQQNPIINAIEIVKIGDFEDVDAPVATIALGAPADATSPLSVNVALSDFSGIDTSTLGAEDIDVEVGGVSVAPGTISFGGFVGGVASYSVAAPTGGWSDGTVLVTLKANEISDLAATPNSNAETSETITLDFTAPPTNPTDATAILQDAQGVDSGGSYGANIIGSAELRIMEDVNNIKSSNFGSNSFILENTGGKQIAGVFLDFRDALYGDSVIDTDGSSGDLVTKPFAAQSGANDTGLITQSGNQVSLTESYFFPGDEPNPDPDANGANGGFRGLLLRFDGSDGGFASGEQIGFSGDMDPNSVAAIAKAPLDSGALNSWDVGGISGAELIGSSFTIMFDDGTFATGYLGSNGTQAGSTGKATQAQEPTATATVTVNGSSSGSSGTYGGTEPVIVVTGTPGETVLVTMSKGFNPVTNTTDGIAQDVADRLANSHPDFQVSNAGNFQTVEVTIGANGSVTVPTGSFNYNSATSNGVTFDGSDFSAGYETAPIVVAASVIDTDGQPTGPVDRVYLTSNGDPVGQEPSSEGPTFLEENGIVVIEAESGNLVNSWQDAAGFSTGTSPNIDSQAQATGDDFIVWQGSQSLGQVTTGIIEYGIQITTPGTYAFQWRSQVGNGTSATEHNDTWMKINADQFYAVQGNVAAPTSVLKPDDALPGTFPVGAGSPEGASDSGFFKVYSSGATNWTWSSNTSDGDAHLIYAEFDAPGTYSVEIAARSSSHVIDRLVLSNVDQWSRSDAQNLNLAESLQVSPDNNAPTAVNDSAVVSGSSVLIDVLDNDSDVDGDTLSISSISAPSNGTAVVQNGDILYTVTGADVTLIDETFDGGTGGFSFADDTFRGTNQPAYASGSNGDGQSGDGLTVVLGGGDNATVTNMSGGWNTSFVMASEGAATLNFSYRLDANIEYEPDEVAEVLVAVDGVLTGLSGNDYIAQIAGGGDSGWVDVTLDLGVLSAGSHDLTLGGFNNKKTFNNESTTVSFDNVALDAGIGAGGTAAPDSFTYTISDGLGGFSTATVEITPEPADPNAFNAVNDTANATLGTPITIDVLANDTGGTSPYTLTSVTTPQSGTVDIQGNQVLYTPVSGSPSTTPIDAAFNTNSDQFAFSDDLFRGTSNPAEASGSYAASGGNTGGGLEVVVGGIDDSNVTDGMSGGWSRDITLANEGQATLSFTYNLTASDDYENNEFTQVLFALDGTLIGTDGNDYLAELIGGGSTGWQTVTLDLGVLDAGGHSFDFGAFNNQKTTASEFSTALFDDITLTIAASVPSTDSFTYVATDDDGTTDTGFVFIDLDDPFVI